MIGLNLKDLFQPKDFMILKAGTEGWAVECYKVAPEDDVVGQGPLLQSPRRQSNEGCTAELWLDGVVQSCSLGSQGPCLVSFEGDS